ncbi:Caspase domain-containing protein [Chitinophaga sp. CF118]|uniref:caspase family protein n=1 Tax=Chitinophaga sp. CF118 TaxID=1884367 RepID=UPI0008E56543|nr:caspase family protein [Chitinophaga sp. CF118]SFD98791.1 Caspase domain-containing protein [Chitinophaga sp. CF118]
MDRALLVGINEYPDPRAVLNGCINDITDMATFLVDNCQFKKSDIRLLVDKRATTAAILERLTWLLNGIRKGDRIVFHYSGHGAQMATRNPEGEVDGLDEVICPVDFDWTDKHAIRDKDFRRIFSAIPQGVNFVWISDSCHSGDLSRFMESPEIQKQHRKSKSYPRPADIAWRVETAREKQLERATIKGVSEDLHLALITGCKSNQVSSDAFFGDRYNGAMTYFLLQLLGTEDGQAMPLKNLVSTINKSLAKAQFSQEPQLEGSPVLAKQSFLELQAVPERN